MLLVMTNLFQCPEIIDKKILGKEDLFNRGYRYEKVELDQSFPKYLLDNKEYYSNFIL